MKLRWNRHTVYSWYWDSRYDCWYKSGHTPEPVLQYFCNVEHCWKDVPTVVTETCPPKPKD